MNGTLHALELRLGDRPEGGLAILSSRATLKDRFPCAWRLVRPFRSGAEATAGNVREIIAAWAGTVVES